MALLGDKAVGSVVKIKENGAAVNYVIKQKGRPSTMYGNTWNGGILVVRQLARDYLNWNTSETLDYENSSIDKYLNNDFLSRLDAKIAAAIMTVKIPYVKGNAYSSTAKVSSGENGLARKVFLLSAYEVGFTTADKEGMFEEGVRLDGFYDNTSRICMHENGKNDTAITWWLRSIWRDSWGYGNKVFTVNTDGTLYTGTCNFGELCRPAFVLPSNIEVDSDGSVIINSAPTITSDKTGDLGVLTGGFICTYSVNDVDAADNVTVTLTMGSTVINTFTAVKEQQYTYSLTGGDWLKITNGSHTFKISATDGKTTVESTATFTRACDRLSTMLDTPLAANDRIRACSLMIDGEIPNDAVCLYEVTNNGNDTTPVWEDCTEQIKKAQGYLFNNKTAENGFAFNFRVSIQRGDSGEGGFITKVYGGFE